MIPRYLFLNRAPGQSYDQNRPETITEALFAEPLAAIRERGAAERPVGLSFILSYLDGPPAALAETLRRLLALSLARDVPVLIVLDGQNWWGYQSDLWNWWDRTKPGFDPANANNVEWTGWGAEHAVKICWRNWGRQIRVLPPPNLASPQFREASRRELGRLAGILREWSVRLPPEKRHLFPGVKIGWEASIGVNAFYYPDGNSLLERYPNDPSHDPTTGLDMKRDFAGGLVPLGYAALRTRGWKYSGAITLADQERITADYLEFISRICHDAGFRRDEIFTHAGGQFAPWEKHYSHRVAINRFSLPGWSLYGLQPEAAGDLGSSLEKAGLREWAAAEWLPNARTPEQWQAAIDATLGFRQCRFLSLYNWEGVRNRPEAVEGIRRALRAVP